MSIYKGDYKLDQPHAVALGSFDGLHAGHRALIKKCVITAAKTGIKSAVCTFDAHPRKVLGASVAVITDTDEKIRRMQGIGVDDICIEHFDRAYADMGAAEFFEDILLKKLCAKALVCGGNYRFGKGGEGDVSLLKKLCENSGVELITEPYVMFDGEAVSSSKIRSLIESGDVEKAALLMQEPFCITSQVVQGKHLGRSISLPTVNLEISPDSVVPRYGVYAAKVYFDGLCFEGAANVGVRPTVSGENVNLEVNIFDFAENVYGKTVRAELYSFIRPEMRFESVDALRQQIIKDKEEIRNYFCLKRI